MFAGTIIAEDCLIQIADNRKGKFIVTLCDNGTGKIYSPEPMSGAELGAILGLMFGSESDSFIHSGITSQLYTLADDFLRECPNECRPIP